MADVTTLLRVFHVTGCLDMGGQEKLLVEFARHADRRRFALHFVSLAGRGALADDLEAEGWPVTTLDIPHGLRPSLILRLARLFRGADVVHTHNDRPLIYAVPAARLARVRRIIHTRHGRGVGISRRQRVLANLAARLAARYVCVSDDCARLAVAQGLPAPHVETLHNGIDTRHFAFTGPRAGGPAVIVARLTPEKDIATLLRATALVVRTQPDFRLAIAGDGPCMGDLRTLAAELRLGERVRFLGMVRDVAGLLATASMYVLSSISEGVSLTLLEAMARGLPVVATRVGGTPEVVTDETGLLVPPGDAAALAAALLRLGGGTPSWVARPESAKGVGARTPFADSGRATQLDNPLVGADPALAERLGRAGRRRVEECFDIRRMVADYEGMYVGTARTWGRHSCLPNRGRQECLPHVPSPLTITEDRHDAVDDGHDGSAGRRGGPRRGALATAARD